MTNLWVVIYNGTLAELNFNWREKECSHKIPHGRILTLYNWKSFTFHHHANKRHADFFFQLDMKKLKFGKNLKKRTDRRKSSCRNRKGRKQEERMVAHQLKVLWKIYWMPKTKPTRYFRFILLGKKTGSFCQMICLRRVEIPLYHSFGQKG